MDTLVGIDNLGKRLSLLLDKAGYSQVDAKNELGVSKNTIGNYIKGGNPETDILLGLSELLEVTMEYLFTGEEKAKKISDEETQLINTYRTLNERQQEKASCYLAGITIPFDGLDNRLRLLIKNTGYKRKEITEGANLFESAISKYVNGGNADPKSLFQLSQFFEVSMEWFLKGEVDIEGLREEENEFIRNYRMLKVKERGMIIGCMDGMILDAENSSKD